MQPKRVLTADDIELSSPELWLRPNEEREGAFATLREERPICFQEEPDYGIMPQGPGYWALTCHEDIVHASRNADVFCSGQAISSRYSSSQ